MWLLRTTVNERRAMLAAYAGYGLDGFDFMVYTFVIPTLITLWGMSKAQAGYIASASLITSAIGGWGAGVLADRYGRVRVLQLTVLWFAAFTCLSGFTHSYGQLLFTRAMQGFGFGGEWCVGSVLVAETIEARHRGKAAGVVQSSWSVGWAAAALAFWAASERLPPALAWKVLFWVGILPALLIVYIRRNVQEPEVYLNMRAGQLRARAGTTDFLDIFRPPLLLTTVLATLLSAGMLGAYYAVTTWLPTFLETERHLSVTGRTRVFADDDRRVAGRIPDQRLAVGRLGAPTWIHAVRLLRRLADSRVYPYARERRDAADRLPAGILRARHFFRYGGVLCGIVSERGARFRPGILLQRRPCHRRRLPGIDRCLERAYLVGPIHRRHDRGGLCAGRAHGLGPPGNPRPRTRRRGG